MQMTTNNVRSGKTRYVFAGTEAHEEAATTKVCPRCGQVLFEDMDVCYGCLYDFSRDRSRESSGATGRSPVLAADRVPSDDPLRTIELDELDDETPGDETRATPVDETVATPAGGTASIPGDADERQAESPDVRIVLGVPRHRREPAEALDDTIDLATADLAAPEAPPQEELLSIVVSSDDMRVRVPLPQKGLTVGRDESSDIVLRSRLVSRSHVRLTPCDGGVMVQDCGATNPAIIEGVPLAGSILVGRGGTIDVCGTSLLVA